MSQWDSMKGVRLPTFKGVDLPKFDGLVSSAAKLDSFSANAAKLESFGANLAKLNARVLATGHCTDSIAGQAPDYFDEFRRASDSLSQAQRGWLAKGLRGWNAYLDKSIPCLAVEVQWYPYDGVFDLRTFLRRRKIQGLQRRARWVRRSRSAFFAWLRELSEDLLAHVAAGLRTGSGSKVLALLKAPPGWTAAIRFRLSLEASLPRILEQLADVLAPNAPSLPRERLPVHGGTVA